MARRISIGIVAVVVAALAAPAVWPAPAHAATGTYLRLAHLSPDTPAVDVLVTGFGGTTYRLGGVSYGDVSTYQRIEPDTYTVQMRPAGAPESTPAVVTGTLRAGEGRAYTAAGLGMQADLAVRVLDDDLSPPPAGQARVRVVQGAGDAGDIALRWNGAPMVDAVAFGSATDYVGVPAGSGSFDVLPARGAETTIPVDLAAGGVYSVIVVQDGGGLAAEVKVDAVGPGSVPAGGIDTGLGGAEPPAPPTWALVGLAVGALGAVLLARQRAHR